MSERATPRVKLWEARGFGEKSDPDNPDSNKLQAISISMLPNGQELRGDVFASDKERLLIKSGTMLDGKIIKMVENFNSGSQTLYVSEDTYMWISGLAATQPEITDLQEMEKTTGYGDIKEETLDLLEEISQSKTVHKAELYSVSDKLSGKLDEIVPSRIMSLVNALAPVDEYLQRHCVNVSLLNGLFGKWMELSKEDVDRLVLCGLLHDCGKALVPPQLLNAPRKLMLVEFEVLKMHPVHGYDLLADFPESVRLAARAHHEKVGEKGYPDGIIPEKITLEARITAVTDIYDAMVSQRAYKNPNSPFSVLATLDKLKGVELDSELVDIFIRNMPKELIGKEVLMSDGAIGVVHSLDAHNIEYPVISINGRPINSNEDWHCVSMYNSKER